MVKLAELFFQAAIAGIDREVGQKFFVDFDPAAKESVVRPNRFFEE